MAALTETITWQFAVLPSAPQYWRATPGEKRPPAALLGGGHATLCRMDWTLVHAMNGFLFHHDAVEDPLLFYVNVSEALFIATLAVVFLAAYGKRHVEWRRAAVAAVLSAGLGLAVGKVIAELVDRARPFVAHSHSVHLFANHAPDPSFPSDHATAAFAIAVAIVLRKRAWGAFALLAAAVLSIGRVALGVHYPSDVIAGAALGGAAALALWADPLRARIEALADFAGGLWDRAFGWGSGRIALLRRR